MEKLREQAATGTESGQNQASLVEQHIEPLSGVEKPRRTEQELSRIAILKENLLERGGMTIETIEEDPFVLSQEHAVTGEGVTIFKPDGTVERSSIEAYRADLAKGREAARFFGQKPQMSEHAGQPPGRLAARAFGWLKRTFGAMWSKLSS